MNVLLYVWYHYDLNGFSDVLSSSMYTPPHMFMTRDASEKANPCQTVSKEDLPKESKSHVPHSIPLSVRLFFLHQAPHDAVKPTKKFESTPGANTASQWADA